MNIKRTHRKCTKCKVSKLREGNFGTYSTGRTRDICNECHTGLKGNIRKHRKCKGCGEVKLSETNFGKSEAGNIKAYCHECTDKNQNYRVCSHCKSDKHISKFTRFPNGKLYQRCQDCKDNKIPDPYKPKSEKRAKKPKPILKPKEKLKVAKKDDGIIDRNIMSFEYQNKQRLSAEEALIKAKKQNEENLKSGKYKAVMYGSKGTALNMVRSIVIKRVS